jgi:hypothetical protein
MEFNKLDELTKYLNDLIEVALETDVKVTAEETMKLNIQRDVYAPYTPYNLDGGDWHYHRTGELLQDVKTTIEGNTLILEDTRSENGKDIVSIIENGGHYDWGKSRNLDEEIGARPFVEDTYIDLKNGLAIESLKNGLKRQGLSVE